jgi:methylmalonyl-CoA mutase
MSNPQAADLTAPTFNEFPPTPYEEWRKVVDKFLKGAPFEKRLVTKTYENIDLQPMYRQEDIEGLPHLDSLPGFAPYLRGATPLGYVASSWDVAQELPYATPAAFNAALRADLARGQNAVNLVLDRPTLAGIDADQAEADDVGKGGLSISSVADLAQALDGVDLENTPLYIQASTSALTFTALLAALVKQQGKSLAKVRGAIGMDPLGQLARDGRLPRDLDGIYDVMAQLAAWAKANAPQLQTMTVQGSPYHNGGASTTQELAFALATAVDYVRAMQARGSSIDDIAPRIRFSLSIGSNFFMEIARLRAARLLWAKIVQAFGGNDAIAEDEPARPHLGLEPDRLRPARQPAARHHRGVFRRGRRLRQPAHFAVRRTAARAGRVLPPRRPQHPHRAARGKPHHPHRGPGRRFLVRRKPHRFGRPQDLGDLPGSREAGRHGEGAGSRLAAGPNRRHRRQARRQHRQAQGHLRRHQHVSEPEGNPDRAGPGGCLGGSDRAHRSAERLPGHGERGRQTGGIGCAGQSGGVEAAIQAALAGATLGEIAQAARANAKAGPTINPVHAHRGAQAFEALRQAAETYVARTGQRPEVFLATMGPLTQHKGRADFSTAFLGVGGFETIYPSGFSTPDEAADAALASGAKAVVICSTDATYPELVPPLVQKLKKAAPDLIVLLAGYPADHVEAFKAAGVDDFIHLAANCQALLSTLQKKMGVAQ